ncbi:hypothetical protein FQZ97_918010 [compost metagenome]
MSGDAYPAAPVSDTLGNHAAWATPTRACAASSEACAAATSGRRASTVPGTPAGMTGRERAPLMAASAKPEAGSPTSTASACSSSARLRLSANTSASVAASSVWMRITSSSATSPASKRRCVRRSVSP